MTSGARRGAAWLAVGLWAAFIWGLGTDVFSSVGTSRFLSPLLDWLWPAGGGAGRAEASLWIRKAAHVCEYGVLALLAFNALRSGPVSAFSSSAALTLALVAAVAVADELRQASSQVRTGTVGDVVLDVAGGAIALVLLAVARALWTRTGRSRTDALPS